MFLLSDPLGTIRVRKKTGTPRSLSNFQTAKQESSQCIPMIFLGSPYLCFGASWKCEFAFGDESFAWGGKNLALITLQIVIAGEGEGEGMLAGVWGRIYTRKTFTP